MLQYNFKDVYLNQAGENVEKIYPTTFYSPLFVGGNGTRTAPYRSTNLNGLTTTAIAALILSQGYHKVITSLTATNYTKAIIGSGISKTFLSFNSLTLSGSPSLFYFKDLTLIDSLLVKTGPYVAQTTSMYITDCVITGGINLSLQGAHNITINVSKCLVRSLFSGVTNSTYQIYLNNNSFVGISATLGFMAGSLHTFENCNLIVNQSSINSYYTNYYVFDNCNFRIGTETDYTPLGYDTPDDRRTEFIDRCIAAGLSMPAATTEYGLTSPIPRWLFTSNQVFEGTTWSGSDINLFEVPRLISFGYNANRGVKIPITTMNNMKASINPANPRSSTGLDILNDSLVIDSTVDITKRVNLYIDSNIIWLGGKKKITKLDNPNDLPLQYGVNIDSIPNLLCDPGQEIDSGGIEDGQIYMLRSNDAATASVTYNGVAYSSSLITRNNIFKGVSGVSEFSGSENAAVYKINDILNYQSIQVRIVNKIPGGNITAGTALTDNYWYFVEHDTDQANTADYVTYNGAHHYVGGSFLASGTDTFTATGNVHLRRCWKQDFDMSTEVLDREFWQDEQKPEWCDVLPEDTRCLMKNNHVMSTEMMRGEDGKYITTGHPEYYNLVTGASGVQLPNYIYMQGTFVQLRLPITTANPM